MDDGLCYYTVLGWSWNYLLEYEYCSVMCVSDIVFAMSQFQSLGCLLCLKRDKAAFGSVITHTVLCGMWLLIHVSVYGRHHNVIYFGWKSAVQRKGNGQMLSKMITSGTADDKKLYQNDHVHIHKSTSHKSIHNHTQGFDLVLILRLNQG